MSVMPGASWSVNTTSSSGPSGMSSSERIDWPTFNFKSQRRYSIDSVTRSAQAVELDLSAYEGRWPTEMLGHTRFPRIGELPYLLTLGPRGFYWFRLVAEEEVEDDG